MEILRGKAASSLIAVATGVAIVAIVMPHFHNPLWVAFEQERAQATAWTGYSEPQLRSATDAILADLVLGPPDFDVVVDGQPVLNERERSHMGNVRGVFMGFFAIAAVLAVAVVIVAARRRATGGHGSTWGAVRTGALCLIVALGLVGLVAVVAFDALFEILRRMPSKL